MEAGEQSDRWREIERLFGAALDRPPDERDAFVARACGEDEDLAAEVRGLLRHAGPEDAWDHAVDSLGAGLIPSTSATDEQLSPRDGGS